MSVSIQSIRRSSLALAAATLLAPWVGMAQANTGTEAWTYEVTVTNITYNQRFTPLLLATHKPTISFFKLGEAASAPLVTLAEEGNIAPLRDVLTASPLVTNTAAASGLLDPGKSMTFTIKGNPFRDRLSLAAMLIPTNDAFVALNTVALPAWGGTATYVARAYDAGSEVNDELCSSIPGPFFSECGGSGGGAKVNGGEGFVHVHRGMHGVGDFKAIARDWRNPVAQVKVRWVR
jgi:Spondin_N